MIIIVYFPSDFSYEAGEKDEIALRLECLNSVDGSTGFAAFLVCTTFNNHFDRLNLFPVIVRVELA